MVNDRFPKLGELMVSKPWMPQRATAFGKTPHQLKIYTESNQSNFSRIFAELSSTQTLAIYRRLLVRHRLRELNRNGIEARRLGTRDVFSTPHGILARAGARAAAKRENT
jgi:hypothetical protein